MERSYVPPGDNQLKNATLIAFGGRRVVPQAPTKFDESRSESARAGSRVEKSHVWYGDTQRWKIAPSESLCKILQAAFRK